MMKTILCLSLIWMISNTDGALQCHSDSNSTVNCRPGEQCEASAVQSSRRNHRSRSCSRTCGYGSHTLSFNYGYYYHTETVHCCKTNGCNSQDLPYPGVQKENGLQCFSCEDRHSAASCNKIIRCVGIEDRCVGVIDIDRIYTGKFFGCVSRNMCEAASLPYFRFPSGTKCCESSFCNSARTVQLNVVLFLLLGLILF